VPEAIWRSDAVSRPSVRQRGWLMGVKSGGSRPRLSCGLVDLSIDQRGDLENHAIEAILQHCADDLFIRSA